MQISKAAEIASTTFAEGWLWKAIVSCMTGIIGYAFPTEMARTAALSVVILIFLDFITALTAVVQDPKQRIESAKMARTITKIFSYGAVVTLVVILARLLPGSSGSDTTNGFLGFGTTGILIWIACTEGLSVLENVSRSRVPLPPGLKEWLKNRIGGHKEQDNEP